MKRILSLLFIILAYCGIARGAESVTVSSPDGDIAAHINLDGDLSYSIDFKGKNVIEPSRLAISTADGMTAGTGAKARVSDRRSADTTVKSPFYRAKSLKDKYNEVTVKVDKNWDVIFRVYDDGVAYRWVSKSKKPVTIKDETVEYRFEGDPRVAAPYVKKKKIKSFNQQFGNSFENVYTVDSMSALDSRRLIFLPMVVEAADGVKVLLSESALIAYPGLYLNKDKEDGVLKGVFAPYPKKVKQGGHNNLQMLVTDREDYIARLDGARALPWRMAVISDRDTDLAASNMSYLLGEPSRVDDISWIKPGKVAWDWWNNWNLDGVDFVTGVNNDTYKAYIDFAAEKGIEYVILDEGWAVNGEADLMKVVDAIDLRQLVDYAAERGVGIILWAGFHAFDRDMENICRHYSEMGVKGFKVDFMDRDDQQMTAFNARAAEMCAKCHMVLDLHGTHKPAGINRTYPNVLNVEGVNGLEQVKWSKAPHDQVTYDVMIPFIRQAAGPMDYTQGAMRNASKGNYYPCNSEPMSQGTRCRQLALYMIFDSPLNMMCDTPSNYRREGECTDFIASVPTVWDETVVVDGRLGEFIVTARRSGDTWYIGGITDWNGRELEIDCSFLREGAVYEADMFVDGVNAARIGRDYRHEKGEVTGGGKLKVKMAPGGGFAARLTKK